MGAWDKGSTRRWRTIRARVLADNRGGMCTLGVEGVCTGRATHVHHVLGRAVTGDDPKYLVAACAACNLHVGEPGKRRIEPRRVSSWSARRTPADLSSPSLARGRGAVGSSGRAEG